MTATMSTFTHIKEVILNVVGLTLVFLFICYAALLNLVHDKNAQDSELILGKRDMQVFTLQKKNQDLLKQVRDLKAAKIDSEMKLDSVKAELASEREMRETSDAHLPYICNAMRMSQLKIEKQKVEISKQEKEISEQNSEISKKRSEIHALTIAIHELQRQLHLETMEKMEALSEHTKCHLEFRKILEQQSQNIKELREKKDQLHYDKQMLKYDNHKAMEEVKGEHEGLKKRVQYLGETTTTFLDLFKVERTSAAVARVEMEEKIWSLQEQIAGLKEELEEKRKAEESELSNDEGEGEEAESDSNSVAGYESEGDWDGCWVNVEDEVSDLDSNASAPDAVEDDEAVIVPAEAKDEYDELYE